MRTSHAATKASIRLCIAIGTASLASCLLKVFLSISYGVIGSIPRALFVTTLWIWAVAFLVSGLLFVMKIKKLLSEMEKGEVLCTN